MSYTCPYCGATSHNPDDEQASYCGRCHRFDSEGGGKSYSLACAQCGHRWGVADIAAAACSACGGVEVRGVET